MRQKSDSNSEGAAEKYERVRRWIESFPASRGIADGNQSPSRTVHDLLFTAFNESPIPMAIGPAADGIFIAVNDSFIEVMGYSRDEVLRKPARSLAFFVNASDRDRGYAQVRKSGMSLGQEVDFRLKSGQIKTFLFTAKTIAIEGEEYLLTMAYDISERKQAEIQLAESERLYRKLTENIPVNLAIYDLESEKYIYWNHEEGLSGRSIEYWNSLNFEGKINLLHPDDRVRVAAAMTSWNQSSSRDPLTLEYRLSHSDGHYIWIEHRSYKEFDGSGRPINRTELWWDITDRKLVEERVRARMLEKETLVREIHHRVKNNLQVVSSILNLQARRIEDSDAQAKFAQCQARIQAIAMVHQELYKADDLGDISIRKYLSDLIGYLVRMYQEQSRGIDLRIEVEDIRLNINLAIPCGMIVNELLTNSLIHAFPQGRTGTIGLAFARLDDRQFQLNHRDDGIGMADESQLKKENSLGLTLIDSFVAQLNGSMIVSHSQGTAYEITFPATTDL